LDNLSDENDTAAPSFPRFLRQNRGSFFKEVCNGIGFHDPRIEKETNYAQKSLSVQKSSSVEGVITQDAGIKLIVIIAKSFH
jgi:hypothetical protein